MRIYKRQSMRRKNTTNVYITTNIYRMTKIQERKTRDFNQVKCIKNESDRFLLKDEEINNR
jgi:hypothetical protein